jgi:sialic acid synthase SpsE
MTEFIAEMSSNHQQDLARCIRFVDTAADIGCAGVKFQLFTIEELFSPEALAFQEDQQGTPLSERKKWELPTEFLPHIASRCREQRILFGCTPFYLEAVAELEPYVDFLKVASYELLWDGLLLACAKTRKPVVLSTGMADMDEIVHAVTVLNQGGCVDLTLLHCISAYPTPIKECNLAVIRTLRERLGCRAGWSDHSVNPAVIYRAVYHWDAEMVEFHLDLDGEGGEYHYGHCWLPQQIRPVIQNIRDGIGADGDGRKRPMISELPDRDWRADPSDGRRPLLYIRRQLGERK